MHCEVHDYRTPLSLLIGPSGYLFIYSGICIYIRSHSAKQGVLRCTFICYELRCIPKAVPPPPKTTLAPPPPPPPTDAPPPIVVPAKIKSAAIPVAPRNDGDDMETWQRQQRALERAQMNNRQKRARREFKETFNGIPVPPSSSSDEMPEDPGPPPKSRKADKGV